MRRRWREAVAASRLARWPSGGEIVEAIIAGTIGYLINLQPVNVWNGGFLFLGGIPVAYAVLRTGGFAGVLAAVIAAWPTVGVLEQPILLILLAGEAAILGERNHLSETKLLRFQLLVWLFAGIPLLYLWYTVTRGLPAWAISVIALKNTFNAVVCVTLGRLGVAIPAIWGRARDERGAPRPASLRQYLMASTALGLVLPALVILFVVVRNLEGSVEREQAVIMQGTARAAAAGLNDAVRERVTSIELMARALQERGAPQAQDAQAYLELMGPAAPGFLTFLVTDREGAVLAAFPTDSGRMNALRQAGFNVADREYFRYARDTRRPFVSDVFVGRGLGRDLIVAISAPLLGRDGEFLGIVEGSVEASTLRYVLGAESSGFTIAVLSPSKRIIFATDSVESPAGALTREAWPAIRTSTPFLLDGEPMERVAVERREQPWRPIAEQTHVVASEPTNVGWSVRVERSLGEMHDRSRELVNVVLLLTFAIFVAIRILSLRLLRDVLVPIGRIREAVAARDWQSAGVAPAPVGESFGKTVPVELVELGDGLEELRRALRRSFAELRASMRERDEVNEALSRAKATLQDEVARRTAELAKALEEARAASHAKTEFLASMSHELRTPLNAVIGSADALREGLHGEVNAEQIEVLDGVEESTRHLLELINDILDMEKISAGRLQVKHERVDLRALAERARRTVAPLAQSAGLQLAIEIPSGELWMHADALRLQQVVVNLLGNAVKFTRAGGHVTLRMQVGSVPGRVERIDVIDDGIGIPSERLQEIFEPFRQVEEGNTRGFGGSGLGLSISRALCEAMGLHLSVSSTEGRGTVFSIEDRGDR